jgi:integrase
MAHVRRHPKSGRWQVRYRDPSGRERSKTFSRKVDADRYAATVTADVVRGQFIDPQLGKATVAEMAERWRQTRLHLAQATKDQDRHLLKGLVLPVFGSRPVASVRKSEVAAWLSGLDVAPATAAKVTQKLSAVFALAVDDGAIKTNPCDGIKRPSQASQREGRALTAVELQKVLDAAESVDPAMAGVVWVMARAGLRIGEAVGLKRGDIDGDMLHVRRSMSRREGPRRVKGRDGGSSIPMSRDLSERLRSHIASQSVASLDGWLFTSARGRPLRYDNWRTRVWSRIVDAAGIGEVHPHDLRHTVATNLFLVDGWAVPQVQAYLGHADPKVTLRVYSHVRSEALPRPSDGHLADTLGL